MKIDKIDKIEKTKPNTALSEEVLSVRQLENLLGMSRSSVYRFLDQKMIPSFRVGTTRRVSIEAYNAYVRKEIYGG